MNYSDSAGGQCGPDSISGVLTSAGALVINPDSDDNPMQCQYWGEAWLVAGTGDITSGGYIFYPWGRCPTPSPNFPVGVGLESEYGECGMDMDYPLVKEQTDLPTSESPGFLEWVDTTTGYNAATFKAVLAPSPDGLSHFGGRFVYEQNAAGGGEDNQCYQQALFLGKFPPWRLQDGDNGLSGGLWFINSQDTWGYDPAPDAVGYSVSRTDWFRANLAQQCVINLYQAMFIDSDGGPSAYNLAGSNQSTNLLQVTIDPSAINPVPFCSSKTPAGGDPVTVCKSLP